MSLRKPVPGMAPAQYLEMEKMCEVKHEYLDAEVYAVSGASRRHNVICLNFASELRSRLRGGSGRVYVSDVKVKIRDLNYFYYPDIVVTCDSQDNDDYVVERPVVVVEVSSPTTTAIDRREKLLAYRKLESSSRIRPRNSG